MQKMLKEKSHDLKKVKLPFCCTVSYSKPILLAKREETLMVSASTCGEMASARQFVTPQTDTVKL